MKYILLIGVFFNCVFSQHILKTSKGKEVSGKFISESGTNVKFHIADSPSVSTIPATSIVEIRTTDGEIIFVGEGAKTLAALKASKEDCEKNRSVKVLFLPFREDFYGSRETMEEVYDSAYCYTIIDDYSALEYFHNNQIEMSSINDYHIKNAAREVGADIVIHGNLYKFEIPYAYSARATSGAEDVLNTNQMMETEPNLFLSLLGTIASEIDRSSEEKSRQSAMLSSGQYIAASIFYIDLRNNEKKYLMQNETILKLGNPGSLK